MSVELKSPLLAAGAGPEMPVALSSVLVQGVAKCSSCSKPIFEQNGAVQDPNHCTCNQPSAPATDVQRNCCQRIVRRPGRVLEGILLTAVIAVTCYIVTLMWGQNK